MVYSPLVYPQLLLNTPTFTATPTSLMDTPTLLMDTPILLIATPTAAWSLSLQVLIKEILVSSKARSKDDEEQVMN